MDRNYQVWWNYYTKHKIQPWDIIEEYNLDFFEWNVLKYLLRYKDKNGVEDLKKAKHYLEKVIDRYKKELSETVKKNSFISLPE